MREIVHGDVVAAACALLAVTPEGWEARIAAYLIWADAADRYRRRLGRAHPVWGNGSLMGAALSGGMSGPNRACRTRSMSRRW